MTGDRRRSFASESSLGEGALNEFISREELAGLPPPKEVSDVDDPYGDPYLYRGAAAPELVVAGSSETKPGVRYRLWDIRGAPGDINISKAPPGNSKLIPRRSRQQNTVISTIPERIYASTEEELESLNKTFTVKKIAAVKVLERNAKFFAGILGDVRTLQTTIAMAGEEFPTHYAEAPAYPADGSDPMLSEDGSPAVLPRMEADAKAARGPMNPLKDRQRFVLPKKERKMAVPGGVVVVAGGAAGRESEEQGGGGRVFVRNARALPHNKNPKTKEEAMAAIEARLGREIGSFLEKQQAEAQARLDFLVAAAGGGGESHASPAPAQLPPGGWSFAEEELPEQVLEGTSPRNGATLSLSALCRSDDNMPTEASLSPIAVPGDSYGSGFPRGQGTGFSSADLTPDLCPVGEVDEVLVFFRPPEPGPAGAGSHFNTAPAPEAEENKIEGHHEDLPATVLTAPEAGPSEEKREMGEREKEKSNISKAKASSIIREVIARRRDYISQIEELSPTGHDFPANAKELVAWYHAKHNDTSSSFIAR